MNCERRDGCFLIMCLRLKVMRYKGGKTVENPSKILGI